MDMYNFKTDVMSLRLAAKETILTSNPLFLEVGINIANLEFILSLMDDKVSLNELVALFKYRFDKIEDHIKRNIFNYHDYLYDGNLKNSTGISDEFMNDLFNTCSDKELILIERLFKFLHNEYERVKKVGK